MRNVLKTTRQVAEEGIYRPSATSSGGSSVLLDGVVFRPGGVAGQNVFTTFAAAMAAVAVTSGTTTLYIDSSVEPAVVPPGVWDGLGVLRLAPYNPGQDTLDIEDGAVLLNWDGIDGAWGIGTITCQCVTTSCFDFTGGQGFFRLNDFSSLTFDPGALVPMIVVSVANSPFEMEVRDTSLALDNTAAPGIPCIEIDQGAMLNIVGAGEFDGDSFLQTGNEIGGPAGSTLQFFHDDTLRPIASALFFGTYTDFKSSIVTNASSGAAALGLVATADGLGGVLWAPAGGGGGGPWMQVGGAGGTIKQVDLTASVQLGVATPTNTSFAGYGGTASGAKSVAIGSSAVASGVSDFAVGTGSTASGGVLIGSAAFGGATASGDGAFAMADGDAAAQWAVAGSGGGASAEFATAFAEGSAQAFAAFACGGGIALGTESTALSSGFATGPTCSALSFGTASGNNNFAATNGNASGGNAAAFNFGVASAPGSFAIDGTADGADAFAVGASSAAHGSESVAFASGTTTITGIRALAVGHASSASNADAAAFGGAIASGISSFASGTGSAAGNYSASFDSSAGGFGSFAAASGVTLGSHSAALAGAEADGTTGFAAAAGYSTGTNAVALSAAEADGNSSTAASGGYASGAWDFAAGNGSVASGGIFAGKGSTAFGGGTATADGAFAMGGTAAFVDSYKIGTDAGAFVYVNSDGAGSVEIHGGGGVLDIENFVTANSATAGAGAALPALPAGYLHVKIAGVARSIPFYNP